MDVQDIISYLPPDKAEAFLDFHGKQQEQIATLTHQLEWFRRQYFGAKSERRLADAASPVQLSLGEYVEPDPEPPAEQTTVTSYERSHRKKHITFVAEDSKLKFDERTPVEEVIVPNPATEGLPEDAYEVIGETVTYRLVQRPSTYLVRKYVQQAVKLKETHEVLKAPLPSLVIPGSFADVTFLAGLVVEKLLYYTPLYRQHQRLSASGIAVERSTLSNLFHRVAELLEPIYHAQLSSILLSNVLTIDETKLKAGRAKGKMKQSYFWPLYGDNHEIVFLFSPSRGATLLKDTLENYHGTIVSDGYKVYEQYARAHARITHAQCWVHCRRKFVEAETAEKAVVTEVLSRIRRLYQIEETIAAESMEKRKKVRCHKSAPIVEELFSFVRKELVARDLLPSNPFTTAAHYMLKRTEPLSVFLLDPQVPLDTNHLEREIRPIAIGRKNWMFCSTEAGARKIAILQSLVSTCKLHDINPFHYLVDVLQRIDSHLIRDVHLLTPRLWKNYRYSPPQ